MRRQTVTLFHYKALNELAIQDGKKYPKKRELYDFLIHTVGKHFIGIIGPRGVGKSVILKQIAVNNPQAFYFSVDSVEPGDLFEIAKTLSERYQYKLLLFDEIHFQPDYDKQLKKIYDFLDIRIIFSSSVSLSLFEAIHDLSRRVNMVYLYPFSFREYIFFKKEALLPSLTLDNILNKEWNPEHTRYEYLFESYLRGGLYPFSLEEIQILPLLENITRKILSKDIPSVARLRVDEIPILEKILKFIGKSSVEGINYSSLAQNIGITKYKAESYIELLRKAFLLHIVFPTGTNVLKEPKVLMHLPYRLLYKSYEESIGGVREDFVVESLRMNRMDFYYLKSMRGEKTPDFIVKQDTGDIVVEIGGKGKGREQFKGIEVEKKIILSHSDVIEGIKRPLFLLGFVPTLAAAVH